jgi:hypothetical protein
MNSCQEGMELNGTLRIQIYADDNILSENINAINKGTGDLLFSINEFV